MNHLVLGHNLSGKTTLIKDMLENEHRKIVVLDFNDAYDDMCIENILLDHVNPLLSPIGIDEAKALNAGYVHNSHCLVRHCEELLREYKEKDENLYEMKRMGIVEEALIRMQVSWDNIDTAYAKILSSRIPLKVTKKHISIESVIDEILFNNCTLLKMKNMYSDHLRAVTFMLLSKLSKITDEEIVIVADDQSTLFNQGNMKMFLETVDLEKLKFIVAFNKATNIPKNFVHIFDEYHLLRFENNVEIKELEKLNIIDEIPKKLKTLKTGKSIRFSKKESVHI